MHDWFKASIQLFPRQVVSVIWAFMVAGEELKLKVFFGFVSSEVGIPFVRAKRNKADGSRGPGACVFPAGRVEGAA